MSNRQDVQDLWAVEPKAVHAFDFWDHYSSWGLGGGKPGSQDAKRSLEVKKASLGQKNSVIEWIKAKGLSDLIPKGWQFHAALRVNHYQDNQFFLVTKIRYTKGGQSQFRWGAGEFCGL